MNFYQHKGLDYVGILRAIADNVRNIISGDNNLVGASTITQQVAKNFLLSREKTFSRKFKEAIIARRIERALEKDKILELYLNEIYLGNRSYGVAAAAQDYFNKSLDEITVPEAAVLAALPKAPSTYNPKRYPERVLIRRNWVIGRMYKNGYLDEASYNQAVASELILPKEVGNNRAYASYFVEELRRELVEDLGKAELYGGGLTIRATLDTALQSEAEKALFEGLTAYDKRHGYRGPLGHLPVHSPFKQDFLESYQLPAGAPKTWQVALVTEVKQKSAKLLFQDGAEEI